MEEIYDGNLENSEIKLLEELQLLTGGWVLCFFRFLVELEGHGQQTRGVQALKL